ncbi:cation:proton antiporter [Deinococcus peraridilitoris]|uniref:Kef-type K+ transport system, membrane component n=1 Tax=Deinococcus peraridilitoris (strain DSM 19664 / LMG 22246 / CIP 109416 / KR-200) TaxID=937777 RepID=K9ZZL9_DEIPD|nr:cation:proton antiporter [Deinococcus peraridilitoris]AFZ66200.1 Kef-type K+ transport system, membrane component [Deinococcus peraridilitoris DSM 19664]
MELGRIFLELGAVTLALAFVGRAAGRFGITPIPLYLLAGLALGATFHLGNESEDFVHVGAEIGAVLLLFVLGLEYTSAELKSNLRSNSGVGVVDLLLNFSPGLLAGFVLGFTPLGAILLGGVTYLSSSGIASKVLTDLGRLGNRETPIVLAVCVLEDIAMAFYLPVVAALLVGGGLLATGVSLMVALLAFGVTFYAAMRFGPAFSRLLNVGSKETLLLSVFGLVLLIAGLADLLKVSAAIGAFLVGIALSGDVAHRTRPLIEPLRDLFAAIFFIFFGLQLDLSSVPDVILPAVILAVVTTFTKLLTGWYGAARLGARSRGRFRAGASLVARGEFSILIAGLGVSAGIAQGIGPLAAVYVLLTAILGPLLARLDEPLAPFLSRFDPGAKVAADSSVAVGQRGTD